MNPRLIARIARWAGGTALAVAVAAGAFFVYRQRLASRALRQVPPAVPPSVQQRSLQFTYSKVQGQQTVFTIHASRATEYSGSRNVLEDVDILIHGVHGERNDQIHTRSCEYDSKSGEIVCHGTVELDLSSVPLGTRAPSPGGGIRVETSAVSFNRDTGTVTTDAPVTFRFPGGEGSGEGAEYSSHAADFVLRRNVKIRLAASGPGNVATVVTSRGGLTFDRANNRLHLTGPVEIRQGDRLINTGELTVDLSERLRPRRAIASGATSVRVAQGLRRDSLRAAGAEILFEGEGRAEQLNVSGGMVAVEEEPADIRLQGQGAAIALDPADQQPRLVDVSGGVLLEITRPAGVTRLNTNSLRLTVAPAAGAAKGLRLVKATTPGEAQAAWISKRDDVQLEGGRLAVAFDADDQIQDLRGAAGVKVELRQTGQKPIVTTAKELGVNFSRGRWTDAEESGDVRVTQGARSGRADKARWLRNEGQFELTGGAFMSEPGGETFADAIVWQQKSGQLRANGHVRSSYTEGAGIPGPVNIVATALDANSEKGQAVYSGPARLWAGDQVIQADRIQFDRAKREMIATGNVLAAFPQGPPQIGLAGKSGGVPDVPLVPKAAGDNGLDIPVMWRVRAQRLRYVQEDVEKPSGKRPATPANENEGRIRLDGGVDAWSSQGRMEAETLVLDFGRGAIGRAELTQATASGGVTVQQGERRGQAANASYDAGAGKFVLWGGKPSLTDTSGDLVTGDRLTFSVANDTILIESSDGSRTLTRHPVPKR